MDEVDTGTWGWKNKKKTIKTEEKNVEATKVASIQSEQDRRMRD